MKTILAVIFLLPLLSYSQQPFPLVSSSSSTNASGSFKWESISKSNALTAKNLVSQPAATLPVPELILDAGVIPATNAITRPVDLVANPNSSRPVASFTDLTVNLAPQPGSVMTSEPDLGQTPTTSLMAPRREPRPPGASIWLESEEQTSLVEWVEGAIKGTRPGLVSIPVNSREEFSRPDQLRREPGLRIFSWRF